ncbi:hypothetical protein U9M48_011661 [Paspalum notatum var. saurae]|uniref:Uncharacterized protein n=1 Tax=Paspalum notatum var. saurae TaxID=547442 RepID=A0AAQ3WHB6_PASNO
MVAVIFLPMSLFPWKRSPASSWQPQRAVHGLGGGGAADVCDAGGGGLVRQREAALLTVAPWMRLRLARGRRSACGALHGGRRRCTGVAPWLGAMSPIVTTSCSCGAAMAACGLAAATSGWLRWPCAEPWALRGGIGGVGPSSGSDFSGGNTALVGLGGRRRRVTSFSFLEASSGSFRFSLVVSNEFGFTLVAGLPDVAAYVVVSLPC